MVTDFKPALAAACSILRGNLPRFTGKFQSSNSEHNFYLPSENVEWTTGFCTGEYWLAWGAYPRSCVPGRCAASGKQFSGAH